MRILLVSCLLLCLGPAAADEKKAEPKKPVKPLRAEQAADAVVKATQAKDEAALKALATKTDPDPKQVIEKLCELDYPEEAEAFAKAAPAVLVRELVAHVAARTRPTLERLVQTAFEIGSKFDQVRFDRDGGYVGLSKAGERHMLRSLTLEKDTKYKMCVVRRFPAAPNGDRKPDDVMLVNGEGIQAYFYLTNLDGTLRRAAFKKKVSKAKPIDKKAAKVELAAEVAFWRQWVKDTRATREENRRKR